jgi:uncharacterized damage-inducible protein DinB
MTKDTISLLAKYNAKVNQDMNVHLSKLTPDQWDHQFEGFYKTIHSLANHLYVSDFTWLKRFGKLRHFAFLSDSLFGVDLVLGSVPFVAIAEYSNKRQHLDDLFLKFADEVADEDLGKNLTYKNFKGIEQTKNFGGTLLHLFNHQTHHRGMISLYLDSLGIENDYSNLISMI